MSKLRLPLRRILPANGSHRLKVTLQSTEEDVPIEYVVMSHNGKHFCLEAVCPHSGGPLYRGRILPDIEDSLDGLLECPWHLFRFNLATGTCEDSPDNGHSAKTLSTFIDDDGNIGLEVDTGTTVVHVEEVVVDDDKCPVGTKPVPCSDLNQPRSSSLVPNIGDGQTWTLTDWSCRVLNEPDPVLKARLALHVYQEWTSRCITEIGDMRPPDQPARQESLATINPSKTKNLGKGGSLSSRIAILHSLASIEQWAIDLAFDIIARFALYHTSAGTPLPREFFTDFLKVAADEAKHFSYLVERLQDLGSFFGALPVHASLWESAVKTRNSFLARLAVVHMVHEARGLDVNPQTILKFERAGDLRSVQYLKEIHEDEVTHVAAGQRWFSWVCNEEELDKYCKFHDLVRTNFNGLLKPPFNEKDRHRAGLDFQYYAPLSAKPKT